MIEKAIPDAGAVIARLESLLTKLEKCSPIKLESDKKRKQIKTTIKELCPSQKGVYVFYQGRKPMYVGRTDRMSLRLLQHGRSPRSSSGRSGATFALILAKHKFKMAHSIEHCLHGKDMTKALNACPEEKARLWRESTESVRKMLVRLVEVEHPVDQAVFEIYAHLRLKTPFNSFVNN